MISITGATKTAWEYFKHFAAEDMFTGHPWLCFNFHRWEIEVFDGVNDHQLMVNIKHPINEAENVVLILNFPPKVAREDFGYDLGKFLTANLQIVSLRNGPTNKE